MLVTVVISGDDVCCSVVFGTLVGVFSVMWSNLLMTSAISCPLWSSVLECSRVECTFTSPVRIECGMFVMSVCSVVCLCQLFCSVWSVTLAFCALMLLLCSILCLMCYGSSIYLKCILPFGMLCLSAWRMMFVKMVFAVCMSGGGRMSEMAASVSVVYGVQYAVCDVCVHGVVVW